MGINKLTIKNFRGIKSMACDKLARITLIGGRNNSGKSSVLEAIKILETRRDASVGADVNSFVRRIWLRQKDDLKSLFNDSDMPFQITASMCNGQTSSLSVRLEENLQGELPLDGKTSIDTASRLGWVLHHSSEDSLKDGRIIRRDSHLRPRMDEKDGLRFSYMSAKEDDSCDWKCMLLSGSVRSGDSDNTIFSKMTVAIQDREISTVINKIYPEIYSVKLVNDQLMVKVRGYDNLLPAKVAGDGVTRIISVLCSLWNCKDGCLCVDEIDNGLHYSVLLDFWDVVADFVDRFNVQLIATTHHLDLLETLSKMAMKRNKEDQVCYVRLAVDENGNHTVARFTGKDLDRALDMGFELRG